MFLRYSILTFNPQKTKQLSFNHNFAHGEPFHGFWLHALLLDIVTWIGWCWDMPWVNGCHSCNYHFLLTVCCSSFILISNSPLIFSGLWPMQHRELQLPGQSGEAESRAGLRPGLRQGRGGGGGGRGPGGRARGDRQSPSWLQTRGWQETIWTGS